MPKFMPVANICKDAPDYLGDGGRVAKMYMDVLHRQGQVAQAMQDMLVAVATERVIVVLEQNHVSVDGKTG